LLSFESGVRNLTFLLLWLR
jgi:hypothetical protein